MTTRENETNNSEEIYILFPHQNLEKLSLITISLYNNLSINGNIINIRTILDSRENNV